MAKIALIIGINYPNSENKLRGCGNDARNLNDLLIKEGYTTTVLSDAPEAFPAGYNLIAPTKANIVRILTQIMQNSMPGDIIMITYSGHGTQLAAQKGAIELDGKTECLIPSDALLPENAIRMVEFLLTDIQLRAIIDLLNPGASYIGITDGCHTGSIFNFEDNLDPQTRDLPKGYAAISGCQDNQTSADAYINGMYRGALTNAIETWIKNYSLDEMLENLLCDSIDKKIALQKDLITLLKAGGFTQRPNIAFKIPGVHVDTLPGQKPTQTAVPVQNNPVPVVPVQTAPAPTKPTVSYPVSYNSNYYQPYSSPINSYSGYTNNFYNNYTYPTYYGRPATPGFYNNYETYQGFYKKDVASVMPRATNLRTENTITRALPLGVAPLTTSGMMFFAPNRPISAVVPSVRAVPVHNNP
ncbi:MAG: caspase family protein [Legionella sp.]|jgi:hypothetical protein